MRYRSTIVVLAPVLAALAASCADEEPPPSVTRLLEDRILLEATMVRCAEDRLASRLDAACANAREAAELIGKAEEQAKREALEAESARKREALRRARDAAELRRQQQEEAERLSRELQEFGNFPPPEGEGESSAEGATLEEGGEPQSVVPADGGTEAAPAETVVPDAPPEAAAEDQD